MTLKEMADKLESLDVDVFASLLGLEYTRAPFASAVNLSIAAVLTRSMHDIRRRYRACGEVVGIVIHVVAVDDLRGAAWLVLPAAFTTRNAPTPASRKSNQA
jgi:hypothetical protein